MRRKLIVMLLAAFIVVLALSGCGGGGDEPAARYLSIEWTPEALASVRYATPDNPPNADGANGQFNASTCFTWRGTEYHRQAGLTAVITDEFGNPVDVPDEGTIEWTCDEPGALMPLQGQVVNYAPNNVGKSTVTATYQDLSDSITVVVFKRLFMTDNIEGCIQNLAFDGYVSVGDFESADLQVLHNGTDQFIVNAPGGMYLVEELDYTWLDPQIRQDLGFISTVPPEADFTTTTANLPAHKSSIWLVRGRNGGYAKIAFTMGLVDWWGHFIDVYLEYSPTGSFGAAF